MTDLNILAAEIHASNAHWWRHPATGERLDRNKGEMLMLVVSELSEAMEGERKDLLDDHLPHRKMAEVELADAKIRLFDFAGGCGYKLVHPEGLAIDISDNRAEALFAITRLVTGVGNLIDSNWHVRVGIEITRVLATIDAYAAKFGYDVDGAVTEKRAYNAVRADHKNEARLAANGKKW
ncbi:hypothetical protein ACQZ5D_23925 [Agrobacterium sp. 22-211-1]